MKKNKLLTIVFSILIFSFVFFSVIVVKAENITETIKQTVVLDAGHGGIDGGVIGTLTKVKESDLNLAVTKKLEKLFLDANFNVVLTRTNKDGLYGDVSKGFKRRDMEKRRDIIKEASPDIFISIHMNKYALKSRRGAQVFYKLKSEDSKDFALNVQKRLNGMEQASRNCIILGGDYYVLNNTKAASILVECGFLSNAEDEKLLISENYQNELALAIFDGAINFLSSK